MNTNKIQNLDFRLNWHPCSQMKDYESFKPLVIKKAYDCYFELADGRKVIDAISSWWCKSLGHNHPLLKEALIDQVQQFEHVIFANTTNEVIVKLSQKLASISPGLNKVFYAGDGSSAIEIAMKMSLHSRIVQGNHKRQKFISLKNGYHGETIGAMSVSDLGLYRRPYSALLFEPILIEPLYVTGITDPKWHDGADYWASIEKTLETYKNSVTAIICEPIVQGAGGMKIYSPDFLRRMHAFAKANDIHLIADEIMTGIGRTGKMLACEHAGINPDFVCLSKGLTSGWVPFSAVLTTQKIYDVFYNDYDTGNSFLHSHTFSGNAIGARLALKTLEIIEKAQLCKKANTLGITMHRYFEEIADETKALKNIRSLGAIVAADLVYSDPNSRSAYSLYQKAIQLGAFLRPLGNTIYWMPPLTISEETLLELRGITHRAILDTIAI